MSKKHFIALADTIRHSHVAFTEDHISVLASFCKSQNGRFNHNRWISYIHGQCGPNGGQLRTEAK